MVGVHGVAHAAVKPFPQGRGNVGQLLFAATESYGQHQINGFLIGGLVLLIGHLLFQALVIG